MVFMLPALSAVAQSELTGCAAKRAEIQNQINYAQQHENTYRLEGLKKALRETSAHCTDRSLQQEREAVIRKQERKVAAREDALQEARRDGRMDKVRKATRKLEEAQQELADARVELH
ncbi:TPA: DUF1090 domain-containing protein [Klebsiella aerogenes]|nr:DUF1090 domain-containing protein [Klebsiella aerogenes]HCR0509841.1 DUF1090 domain-containing protein [Klebsiella aerogenes]HDS5547989.1 DUF1090 domain-containing protein [Klebsiella aerogenes]HDT0776040.1 DUF1090 domain-containing protein [Klebsiella aerogenes]HDU6292168.1 DUF1090 domain-containing protein [Klebsiella aerogenes]